jgi:hypothetical protein
MIVPPTVVSLIPSDVGMLTYCKIRLGDRNAGCTYTLTVARPHPECLRAVRGR